LSKHYDKQGKINPNVGTKYVKTKVFRMYPKKSVKDPDEIDEKNVFPRYYDIDGERYKVEPVQIKIRKCSLKVFCLNPNI
jgi:hypothetical protein